MRIFFLVLFVFFLIKSEAQFNDDFSDGNFSDNPTWVGLDEWFIIDVAEEALRLNAPAVEDNAWLFTASNSMENANWHFSFKMGFNPSAANYMQVYLAADKNNPSEIVRALYVELGTSDDNISLWETRGGAKKRLIEGVKKRLDVNTPNGEVRVKRNKGGEITLETNTGNGWEEEGKYTGHQGFYAEWFGVNCFYTATRSKLFWFDDFVVTGEAFRDTIPPTIENITIKNNQLITIDFSKQVAELIYTPESFAVQPGGLVPKVSLTESSFQLELTYAKAIEWRNGEHIIVSNITDQDNNRVDEMVIYPAQLNDLVISEIMPDPSPPVGLPDSEFIELFNRSDFPISLKNYQITVSAKPMMLPDVMVFPGDYLLLVPSNQQDMWLSYPTATPISSWVALPNTTAEVVLWNAQNEVVSAISYSATFGDTSYKKDGGWSFELIDIDNLSNDTENWAFSVNQKGGTPGESNSIEAPFPDVKAPLWEGWYVINDSCIVIEFSEPVSDEFISSLTHFKLLPTVEVKSVMLEPIFRKSCTVCFSEKFIPNVIYTLELEVSPSDYAGNTMKLPDLIQIGRPVEGQPFDLVINELLYDPKDDVKDFVELYNRSEKILDLSHFYAAKDDATGLPDKLIPLSDRSRLFFPGDYLVFTSDKAALVAAYNSADPTKVFEVKSFPNYVNAGGTVFITDVGGNALDRFDYSERLHFPLLSSKKGVSLERIDVDGSTNDANNWHSAAADYGYATPTQRNSQAASADPQKEATFVLEPEVFTPNLDGVDDLLFVRYNFPEAGYSCTIEIFNQIGNSVRKLVNNQLVGSHGFFQWDGTNDNSERCNSGIYIVLIKWFNLKGEVKETKKVTVLGR